MHPLMDKENKLLVGEGYNVWSGFKFNKQNDKYHSNSLLNLWDPHVDLANPTINL
jgi:hypothetical protein